MAVESINLVNVSISLAEFQKMSDGKHNAGEVSASIARHSEALATELGNAGKEVLLDVIHGGQGGFMLV